MITDRCKNILVIGAGEAGRMVASGIACTEEINAVVVGFLDDDPALEGKSVSGVPVLGKTGDLESLTRDMQIDEIILAIPTAPGRFVREMVKRSRRTGLPYKMVPGMMEIIKGTVHIDQIRDVRVEDLLGRETVQFDIESAEGRLGGKKILITGAGGSIGSELCRQLSKIPLEELIILGRGENRIFELEEELRAAHPDLNLRTVINNLREPERLIKIIRHLSPGVVYHTAAHKHVHYMERDPEEAVLNNVSATLNLIKSCEESGVDRFIFISTDKAADPMGVMGATKRLMELYLKKVGHSARCVFITVRFGNVIGSKGSVVPLFIKQISRGGPVTVSDPKATRYFMTVKEASLLVIEASLTGEGGEIYILDMGEALNILEMARDIIILTGHQPQEEIPIEITGLREGEKLHEILVGQDESLEMLSGSEKIMLAKSSTDLPEDFEETIKRMIEAAEIGDRAKVLGLLSELVPGFNQTGRLES